MISWAGEVWQRVRSQILMKTGTIIVLAPDTQPVDI